MGQQIVVDRPFQFLYMDLLGPYPRSRDGHTTLLVCLDKFTKFAFAHPLRTATAENIIKFLRSNVFSVFGIPEVIYTDNGAQFKSEKFLSTLRKHGIQALNTPVYCPQSNAAERINRSILAAIRSYLKTDQKDWDKYIYEILSSLRSSIHQAIQVSPFKALFGYEMVQHGSQYELLRKLDSISDVQNITHEDRNERIKMVHEFLKKNLEKAHKQYERAYNLRSRPVQFVQGQTVFKRNVILSDKIKHINAKLCPKFVQCRVKKVLGQNRYELENESGKSVGIYHAQDLRA